MEKGKRKLKSRNSSEKEFEVVSLPCVQGGWLKDPRVLPIEDMGANGRFVPVTAKDTWLTEVLVGLRGCAACREALTACLSELRYELTGQADDLPMTSVAQSIREKLAASGLSEDDSEEDFGEISRGRSSARSSPKERSRSSSARLVVREVTLRGIEIFATVHKFKILLQYSPENLQNFVALAKKYSQEDAEEKKNEKAERRQQAPGDTHFHS